MARLGDSRIEHPSITRTREWGMPDIRSGRCRVCGRIVDEDDAVEKDGHEYHPYCFLFGDVSDGE